MVNVKIRALSQALGITIQGGSYLLHAHGLFRIKKVVFSSPVAVLNIPRYCLV